MKGTILLIVWADTNKKGSPLLADIQICFPEKEGYIDMEQRRDIIHAIDKITPVCLINYGCCDYRITKTEKFMKKKCEDCE